MLIDVGKRKRLAMQTHSTAAALDSFLNSEEAGKIAKIEDSGEQTPGTAKLSAVELANRELKAIFRLEKEVNARTEIKLPEFDHVDYDGTLAGRFIADAKKMAQQHFPADAKMQQRYEMHLLRTKIRELASAMVEERQKTYGPIEGPDGKELIYFRV